MRALAAIVALVVALLVVACGSNPNEHVQSNEFFRPSANSEEQQSETVAQDQSEDEAAEQDSQESEDSSEQMQDADEAQDSETEESTESASTAEDQQEASEDEDQQDDPEPAAPLDTSEDIVRRYSNPSYGYSFELICSPFCDPNSNGVDRVSFLSETGRALIGVDVVIDDESENEALLRSALPLGEGVEFASVSEVSTVTGEAAQRFEWEEDRRATGGFQVRWNALLVRTGGVAIVLRAGAVSDDYEGVSEALERALTSFILPLELTARPGRYERFGFVIEYDTADVSQEFGQPTNNPPSSESGIFVLQSSSALKAVLTWQVLGEAFYDGDTAIEQSLRDSLGIENVTGQADWGEVDGRPARTGETETQFGEGLMKIQSFAWYCQDGGREFSLHVLDPDDPESVALPLIAGFRCSAEESEAAGEDSP